MSLSRMQETGRKFVTIQTSQDRMVQSTADWVAQRLQEYGRPVRIRLHDGTRVESEDGHASDMTIMVRTREALASLFRPPVECSLGESYILGDVDVVGNFQDVFPFAEYLLAQRWTLSDRLRFMWRHVIAPYSQAKRLSADRTGARHSPARDFGAVQFHDNLPTEFYRLWLDRRMVYSCAYFTRSDDDLDEAQADKLDYMCRKLRLQPGDRVLDIRCGWGGFALYAAQYYGASVVGITLSLRQAEVARKRIAGAGLTQQCTIGVADYRDLADQEVFDKIVSTEMVKHVGRSQLHKYFHQIHRLLKPDGVFLNHGIASHDGDGRSGPFVDRYVFPDAEVVPLHQVVTAAEAQEWEVRDVESLREQYALTLDHWVSRLEKEHGRAVDLVGETTYRVWRLYLAASAYWFRKGRLNVYQVLCAKPSGGRSSLPLTREDWYSHSASGKAHKPMSAAS